MFFTKTFTYCLPTIPASMYGIRHHHIWFPSSKCSFYPRNPVLQTVFLRHAYFTLSCLSSTIFLNFFQMISLFFKQLIVLIFGLILHRLTCFLFNNRGFFCVSNYIINPGRTYLLLFYFSNSDTEQHSMVG